MPLLVAGSFGALDLAELAKSLVALLPVGRPPASPDLQVPCRRVLPGPSVIDLLDGGQAPMRPDVWLGAVMDMRVGSECFDGRNSLQGIDIGRLEHHHAKMEDG